MPGILLTGFCCSNGGTIFVAIADPDVDDNSLFVSVVVVVVVAFSIVIWCFCLTIIDVNEVMIIVPIMANRINIDKSTFSNCVERDHRVRGCFVVEWSRDEKERPPEISWLAPRGIE